MPWASDKAVEFAQGLSDTLPDGALLGPWVVNERAVQVEGHGGPGTEVVGRPTGPARLREIDPGPVHGRRHLGRRRRAVQRLAHLGVQGVEHEADLQAVTRAEP